jgi:polysaccharide pyruvyl transferase WcaK-like protein
MKITIIGWYGTETIGDRAILAGILSYCSAVYGKCQIQLGSLYPFFTERTLVEDSDFYKSYCVFDGHINLFNLKNSRELEKSIDVSDVLLIGGGPLMHINEMIILDYAFKYAAKKRIKRVIFGCGVGPIFYRKYEKLLINIFKKANKIILRDQQSKVNAQSIFKRYRQQFNWQNVKTSLDPAVQTCYLFKKNNNDKVSNEYDLVVNLRSFPMEYAKDQQTIELVQSNLNKFFQYLKSFNGNILLVPMHYFYIGNDDRYYLNEIKQNICSHVHVQNKPLTLEETLKVFKNAKYCVGMRFHSIVMQTIVNGYNYVLDYAEPKKGKIYGFLKDINFNFENYNSLQQETKDEFKISFKKIEPEINTEQMNSEYRTCLTL